MSTVATPLQIWIEVEGGSVRAVYASDASVAVEVVDIDVLSLLDLGNAKEAEELRERVEARDAMRGDVKSGVLRAVW